MGRLRVAGVLALALCGTGLMQGQEARGIVEQAVSTELRMNNEDHTRWKYRDDERDKGSVSIVVETDAGSVKRLMELQGHPLSADDARAEDLRIQDFIHDPAKLEKKRKDGASDDKSARELLAMLPDAFTWKVASDNGPNYHLQFAPDPSFRPPDMQARVLGAMSGELVVEKKQHRIATISGRLTQDVTIGFGLLGRLKAGGTFRVERREILPKLWAITETHVHIDGKALLFKQIGQQQDELQTDFSKVPNGATLEQAAEMSKSLK